MTRLYRIAHFSCATPITPLTGLSGLVAGSAPAWCLAGRADAGVGGAPIQVPAGFDVALGVAAMVQAKPGVCLYDALVKLQGMFDGRPQQHQ
jgi:hypothetical protein